MILKKLFGKAGDKTTETAATKETAPAASVASAAPAAVGEQNPNEPTPAAHLEQAMVENVRADTPETRSRVFQELLFSDLLLALADVPPGSEEAAKKEVDPNNVSVAILSNPQGMRFSAAFTSGAAARRWRPEGGQFVSIRGQDIYKLLEPSPADVIVINPGSTPFIVLPKVEYKQLALGVVPQSAQSPVQVAAAAPEGAAPGAAPAAAGAPQDGQMQVAFPPDVFSDTQKAHALNVMQRNPKIEAAVLGAILPPNAQNDNWVRTVFLRVMGVEENNDAMQNFCLEVRKEIAANNELFKEVGFEVGVMPDPGFWAHMHQNGIILFDKNPPPPQPQQPTA